MSSSDKDRLCGPVRPLNCRKHGICKPNTRALAPETHDTPPTPRPLTPGTPPTPSHPTFTLGAQGLLYTTAASTKEASVLRPSGLFLCVHRHILALILRFGAQPLKPTCSTYIHCEQSLLLLRRLGLGACEKGHCEMLLTSCSLQVASLERRSFSSSVLGSLSSEHDTSCHHSLQREQCTRPITTAADFAAIGVVKCVASALDILHFKISHAHADTHHSELDQL